MSQNRQSLKYTCQISKKIKLTEIEYFLLLLHTLFCNYVHVYVIMLIDQSFLSSHAKFLVRYNYLCEVLTETLELWYARTHFPMFVFVLS